MMCVHERERQREREGNGLFSGRYYLAIRKKKFAFSRVSLHYEGTWHEITSPSSDLLTIKT